MATSTTPGKTPPPIIVIKKIRKKGHGGHHGGAWKIAYADFVTAMMAFFLLMWLLSFTDPGTRKGIADYFNRPLKSLLTAGPGAAPTSAPKPKIRKQVDEEHKKADLVKLKELKNKLDLKIATTAKLRAFKSQIKVEITTEGLRVTIVDQKNRPMFAIGSAVLEPYTKVILDQIGGTLNGVDNPISIAGHTDALQYAGGDKGYSNWELSAERANSARRELIVGGMHGEKVMQVRGLAGSVPLDQDLTNPANRRISIVVLNNEAVERLIQDGTAMPSDTSNVDVTDTGAASAASDSSSAPSTESTTSASSAPPPAAAASTAPAGANQASHHER